MLNDHSCESCQHKNVCKLRETREKLEEKLKEIHIEEDSRIHVVSKCDEYAEEYGISVTPFNPTISSPNPVVSPTVTWGTSDNSTYITN